MNSRWTKLIAVVLITVLFVWIESPLRSLWPPLAALAVIIITRHALVGLLAGGFAVLMGRVAGRDDASSQLSDRSLETAAAGLGILCFFDGLANSMVVGRVSRDLADRAGTARVKLAYIVDSTSSAVACVAFVSTWIAFQLSMISEAYEPRWTDGQPLRRFPGVAALQLLLLVHSCSSVRGDSEKIPSRSNGALRE